VAQARTQLDSASVADTDIAVQRDQYEHAIAVLTDKPPAALDIPDSAASVAETLFTAGRRHAASDITRRL